MKAFVIGGAGFIGSHIVDELLKQHFKVVVIDNLSNGKKENIPANVTFYQMDILDGRLEQLFEKEKPQFIFHHAAQTSVKKSMTHPVKDTEINVLGTIHLLQCAVKHHVKHFIFASSAAVYGVPTSLPMKETAPVQPISFYGSSKAVAETYIKQFSALYDIQYTILRYANVYGPRQNTEGEAGVMTIFLDKALRNEPITIFGDGAQTRDFVYVKDVAAATVQTIHTKKSATINISAQTATSINTLIDHIGTLCDSEVQKTFGPRHVGDIAHSTLCNEKAKQLLRWSPAYTIERGLAEMYEQDIEQDHVI